MAELAAGQGNIALTKLRYTKAAARFGEAAAFVPAGHPDEQVGYLDSQADALYRQGDEKGENAPLVQSIAIWHLTLARRARERVPLDWAMTQNNSATRFGHSGNARAGRRGWQRRSRPTARLGEYTRERVPLQWATTQNNLGNALSRLGERESGTARLQEAVAAYRAALGEYTRERVPLQWAMTQNNLGTALSRLGERESGTARLLEAVAAYRAALAEYTRERVPLDWATTQNNLGTALGRLGERESGTARLAEAVAAYRAALEEWTRERVPLDWATTQNNLGNALLSLGERESGTARLEAAVAAYRASLGEWTRAAVAAYRASLGEWTRDRVPLQWAMTQNNLGTALWALGARESGTARLAEAVAAFDACLTITEAAWPEEWVQEVRSHRDQTRAEIARRAEK